MKLKNFKLALSKLTNVSFEDISEEFVSGGYKTLDDLISSHEYACSIIGYLCSWRLSAKGHRFWSRVHISLSAITDVTVESWGNIKVGQTWKTKSGKEVTLKHKWVNSINGVSYVDSFGDEYTSNDLIFLIKDAIEEDLGKHPIPLRDCVIGPFESLEEAREVWRRLLDLGETTCRKRFSYKNYHNRKFYMNGGEWVFADLLGIPNIRPKEFLANLPVEVGNPTPTPVEEENETTTTPNCTCVNSWSGWDRLCPINCLDPRLNKNLYDTREREAKEEWENRVAMATKEGL